MSDLYEQDFHAWAHRQSQLLREGRAAEADLDENPSLRPALPEAVQTGYRYALLRVDRETGLSQDVFPPACPYGDADILDPDFLPGEL